MTFSEENRFSHTHTQRERGGGRRDSFFFFLRGEPFFRPQHSAVESAPSLPAAELGMVRDAKVLYDVGIDSTTEGKVDR
jgi:hypothetical protein